MNSSSNVIMAATMIMVVSLVMVLSLLLVILAELYCSFLLNRRRRRQHSFTLPTTIVTTASHNLTISTTNDEPSSSNITTGVLQTSKPFLHLSNFLHESDLEPNDFVYISNPIYSTSKPTTPFETPQSSPSRLETGESSTSDEEDNDIIGDSTPTLTPMKDLPEKACSVSLKDTRSLESSASESNNNNGDSSSSSGSLYTSPSW